MSSLKNLVKTRTYRERSQPKARAKLGMLEKHKDYKLRAVDFHRKEDALKKMKEKAALKNPDEFYFNMVRTKQVNGVHQKQDKALVTEGEMGRFTKEDIGYLAMKQVSEGKKVKRLRASLHELDAQPKNKHTLFVGSDREAAAFKKPEDFARHLNTAVEHLGRASHRPRSQAPPESSAEGAAGQSQIGERVVKAAKGPTKGPTPTKKEERAKAAKYSELKQREAREAKLTAQLGKLRRDKVMHAKGHKRKMTADDGKPRQFKFKQVRSR